MDTTTVSFPAGKRSLAAYYAKPDGTGPFPGILVIHEAWGLNDHIRDVARRFAAEGYAALAVDLFSGRNAAVCMFSLFLGMRNNSTGHNGIRDLKAALDYLAQQPEVDPARLGAVGYCLGGGLAIGLACADDRLQAIAPYYGMNPNPLTAVARACPVVGSYPAKDFTASAGRALKVELDRQQVPNDIKIYEGARHSFFNDSNPASYDAAAAADSWERVKVFFKEYV